MLRPTFACLAASLALLLLASTARGHEPSWEGERRDHEHREAQRVPGDERYGGWQDPYASERRWSSQLGLGGGGFAPFQGDGGGQAQIEALASSPSGHFRIGGEFLYRGFETRIFNVDDVDVDSYQFNLVMHWVGNPGHFTPYLGGGLGLQLNDVSRRDVVLGNPTIDLRDDVGLGYGVFGILGFEVPIDERVTFFAEGRINFAYQVTGFDEDRGRSYTDYYEDGVDDVNVEDFGGGSGLVGVRIRF